MTKKSDDHLIYTDDHIIDTKSNTTWALACAWRANDVMMIPDFLRVTPDMMEGRKARNLAYKPPAIVYTPEQEAWRIKRDAMKALQDEVDRQKSARKLAALKDKHPGQKYDRKTKTWVTATVMEAPDGNS